jgi:NTE family protein
VTLWMGAVQITMRSIVEGKLKCSKPDLLIRPDVTRFGGMDFYRIEEILAIADRSKDTWKRQISTVLGDK